MSFPNRLGATAEVAQEGFHAPLQSTFVPGSPERTGVLKRDVAVQEGTPWHLLRQSRDLFVAPNMV
jgi:hypothetical protein